MHNFYQWLEVDQPIKEARDLNAMRKLLQQAREAEQSSDPGFDVDDPAQYDPEASEFAATADKPIKSDLEPRLDSYYIIDKLVELERRVAAIETGQGIGPKPPVTGAVPGAKGTLIPASLHDDPASIMSSK